MDFELGVGFFCLLVSSVRNGCEDKVFDFNSSSVLLHTYLSYHGVRNSVAGC